MASVTERLALLISANPAQAVGALGQVGNATRKVGDEVPRLSRVGQTLTRNLTPAALGVAGASALMFNAFDEGADALRAAGATGDEFTESMKRVAGQVPASFGEVGRVMGELHQRTKLTGPALEELTQQVLELQELGQNVSVDQLTRVFGDWGIAAEDGADSLDTLFRISQTTGVEMGKLSDLIVRFGAPMRQLGFSFEEAAGLMAQFEAQGVNTQLVAGSMRVALGRMAKAGEEPIETFARLVEQIKTAGDTGEANSIALEAFGARAGPDMAAAIREGRFDLEQLTSDLAANTDSIHEAAEGTRDWAERLSMIQNRVIGVLGPFGQFGMAVGGVAAGLGPLLTGLSKVRESFSATGSASNFLKNNWQGLAAGAAFATLAFTAWQMKMQEAERQQRLFQQAVDDFAGSIREAGDPFSALATRVADSIAQSSELANALADSGLSAADMTRAIADGGDEWERFKDQLTDALGGGVLVEGMVQGLRDQYVEATEAAGNMNEALEEQADAIAKTKNASDDAAASQGRFATQISDVKKAADDEIASLTELLDIINGSIDAGFRYQDSIFASEDAVQALIDAQTDGVSSARDIEQAELDAAQALVDQSRAAADAAEDQAILAGEHLTAADKAAIQRGELQRLQEKYPGLRDEIQGFINSLNAVPALTKAKVTLNIEDAMAALNTLKIFADGIMGGLGNFFAGPRPAGPPPGGAGGPRSAVFNTSFAGKPSEREARRVERGQRRLARSVFGAVT
jgi:TP901 family phage tail tape measure protein